MKPLSPENFLTLFWCVPICGYKCASACSLWGHIGPLMRVGGWIHSTVFMAAVEMGVFSETLVTFHPGVITMWLAALRTFFTEPHVSVQGLALARWFIGDRPVNRDWCRSGAAISVVRTLDCGHRRGVSILLTTLFSAIPSRPHRCIGGGFCPADSPVSPALSSDPPKTPLPHRFWNCVWPSLPCQKQFSYSALVAAYLLRPVSESGGNVAGSSFSGGLERGSVS